MQISVQALFNDIHWMLSGSFFLAKRWQAKTIAIVKINAAGFVLLAFSLLLTFPPFADLLLGKW